MSYQEDYSEHGRQTDSSNPFASDGFAGTPEESRPLSHSVAQPTGIEVGGGIGGGDDTTAPAAASSTQSSSSAHGAAHAAASAIGAGFETVKTTVTSSLGSLANLLPYEVQESGELDESKSKFGKVTVGEPELRGGTFTSYTVYKVVCSAGSSEHVFRRYSDFVWLRNVLVKSFPGIFIPPLPPKAVIGNKDESFVESRRSDLQRWLQRVIVRNFLADHEAVSVFLTRATSQFESDQKELLKAAESKPLADIVSLYKDLWPEIARLPATDGIDRDIDSLRDFLQQSDAKMNTLVQATDKFVATSFAATNDLSKMSSLLQANYSLEKEFQLRLPASIASKGGIPARVDIAENVEAWYSSLKWSTNAFDDLLLNPLKFESQDIGVMLDVLKSRAELASKYTKSLAKAQKWTSEPRYHPKNEKQEIQKAADEAQARDEGQLLQFVTHLILHAQFDQFWTFRVKQFKRRMNQFANHQMEATKQMHETWRAIAATTAS